MLAPVASGSRAAGSRVLVLIGVVCAVSGRVAGDTAPTATSIRPPMLASYVQPAGLKPAGVPESQKAPVDTPTVMNPSPYSEMPAAPVAPVAVPSALNPTPFRAPPHALPAQPFMERAPQYIMPQAVEPSETDAFMSPLQMFFFGLAAGGAVGAAITKKLMNSMMQESGEAGAEGSLELGMAPGRAGVLTMAAADDEETAQNPSRRELFAKAGAALAGFSAAQAASAKAGQFSKASLFGTDISSPYQPGGPQGLKGTLANPETTYGYRKSDGAILSKGYDADVAREKAAFEVSAKIVTSQGPNIDSKTWWLVRDNMRGQAYTMKANMLALNSVLPEDKKSSAEKAYKTFWKEVDSLDLACTKKEYDLAKKEYGDVLAALDAYKANLI